MVAQSSKFAPGQVKLLDGSSVGKYYLVSEYLSFHH